MMGVGRGWGEGTCKKTKGGGTATEANIGDDKEADTDVENGGI